MKLFTLLLLSKYMIIDFGLESCEGWNCYADTCPRAGTFQYKADCRAQ